MAEAHTLVAVTLDAVLPSRVKSILDVVHVVADFVPNTPAINHNSEQIGQQLKLMLPGDAFAQLRHKLMSTQVSITITVIKKLLQNLWNAICDSSFEGSKFESMEHRFMLRLTLMWTREWIRSNCKVKSAILIEAQVTELLFALIPTIKLDAQSVPNITALLNMQGVLPASEHGEQVVEQEC